MKNQPVNTLKFPMRRIGAAALLCCAMVTSQPPAWAAAGDDTVLNFVGADIEAVIKAVGHYTNITFLIDPRVKGQLTLVSEGPLTKTQAFSLLTSALRLQGFSIVSGDGYAKVVPEAEAKLQATPTQVGGTALKGDQIATQIFQLNYESAANLVTVLRPLITPNNTINANPGNNTLVVTDYADNLKRLGKIVAALDAPSHVDLDVIPVRYAIASDLATMLNKLLEPGAGGGGDAGRVSILPDPRTNSLVVRAPSAARANLAKSLIAKLDQPTQQLGNVHVVYLKNAEATKLAQTLRSVVSGDSAITGASLGGSGSNSGGMGQGQSGGSLGGGQQGGMNSGNGGTGTGSTNPLLNAGSGGSQQLNAGGAGGFIQADPSTNTLIITAPESVYRNLRAVIDQLDVRRAQVYIESLVVEVSSDKASEFGVQWMGATGNENSTYRVGGVQSLSNGTNNLASIYTGLAAGKPAVGNGLTIGVFKQLASGALGLGAVAHALETDGGTNILSTPNLVTLDNEVATIRVGQNVPILTGSFTTTSGTNSNPFQTVDRKDVGLTLKVRPQISEGGTVRLAIYNESSSIDTSISSDSGLILKNRVIETNVIADDGQVIVLGGLISDDAGDSADKVRGLADIPVLGNLFKYQKRQRKKTNLMVFLRPVVMRTRDQSNELATDRYDYIRATQQAIKPDDTVLLKDLGQPLLPQLQNGQPAPGVSSQLARPVTPYIPAPADKTKQ
ncbi:MAG: type II secretion system secretin GspD [Burkholderiaceae bacterium]|nr:type II secretion system secretin GspD [Burkholderiaceae bacterium]